jgi:hypothetical protein
MFFFFFFFLKNVTRGSASVDLSQQKDAALYQKMQSTRLSLSFFFLYMCERLSREEGGGIIICFLFFFIFYFTGSAWFALAGFC